MSTPNFKTQEQFSLYVTNYEITEEEVKEYEREYGEGSYDYESDCQCFYDGEIENFKWTLDFALNKKFKRELNFFEITLEDGYYTGIQIMVNPLVSYSLELNPYEMDNEDCHCYFDTCRSKAIKQYESEVNFINKKLLPYISENTGFELLECVGVFSNGEAIYEYPNRRKQVA